MSQSKITVDEVERVARLARLAPSPIQTANLARDLSAILDYVTQLSEVDTSDVPATAHALLQVAPFREDRVIPGLTREDALAAAPSAHDGGFAVPKVLEVES
jgi:aspartyl-tRNA(Asn)/glutamyl-tRNA(Gln) amidotransferase subunit C